MAKGSLVDFLGDEDKKKLLNYTRASQLPQAKTILAAATVADDAKEPTPPSVCEFVRGFVYGGSDARLCIDKTFCPSRVYAKPEHFKACFVRLQKLREKKEHP